MPLSKSLSGLSEFPQFILWKSFPNGDRTDKKPVSFTGEVSDAHNPAIWMTHEYAEGWARHHGAHVGFVFTERDPFFFIDIDNCLLPDGQWSREAMDLCAMFAGAAIEVSQSGRGLHILGRGQ